MHGHGADPHEDTALAVHPKGVLDLHGHLLHVLAGGPFVHLVDQRHVGVAHAEHKVHLTVGEHVLDHVQRHGVIPLIQRPDHEHRPGHLGGHVQLLGPHVDVADEDVVGDDVLDERTLVVFLLIVVLGGVQRHRRHGTDGTAHAVVTAGKHRVVKVTAPAGQRFEGLALQRYAVALGRIDGAEILGPLLADTGQLAAGDDRSLRVNHTDGAIGRLLKLQNYVLKNSSGHVVPPADLVGHFVQTVNSFPTLYRQYNDFARGFHVFYKFLQIFLAFCRYIS